MVHDSDSGCFISHRNSHTGTACGEMYPEHFDCADTIQNKYVLNRRKSKGRFLRQIAYCVKFNSDTNSAALAELSFTST